MFLFEAYRQIGVSLASLAYYCGPVIVMALSPLLFKERLTRPRLLGFAAVLFGVFLVNGQAVQSGETGWGLFCGAMRYSAHGAFDYIELSPEYAIMEIVPPARWVGCEIRELDLRLRHNVNIIGIREGDHINPVLRPDHAFLADEHIIIAGEQKNILKLLDK